MVLATHSDVSLALLSDATAAETARLSRVRYQDNDAALHCDPAVMPHRRKVWSSWNYTEQAGRPDRISLTYWMNRLQAIPQDDPIFLTLNPQQPIREEFVYDRNAFRHPVFNLDMAAAVAEIRSANGGANRWFCRAWLRHGFHEDGFASALEVACAIDRRDSLAVAAE